MAELGLNDRLQPALLDRLIDDERSIIVIKVTTSAELLEQLVLPVDAFVQILRGQGLTIQKQEGVNGAIELHCTSTRAAAGPAQLRSLIVKPPGAPAGVALRTFATFESRVVPNVELESNERRMISMRRLREYVHRDLGWLFNAVSIDSEQDLSALPHVASSVLNYGLPAFAGRMASSIDQARAAERLRRAIELFEPRLSNVRVEPRARDEAAVDDGALEFTIEAELWGQPVSQHLQLRTKIDLMTGDISLADDRGG
jgi:type VI secretion system protein ImpF